MDIVLFAKDLYKNRILEVVLIQQFDVSRQTKPRIPVLTQASIFETKQRKLQLWRRSVAHAGLATFALNFIKNKGLFHLQNLVLSKIQ